MNQSNALETSCVDMGQLITFWSTINSLVEVPVYLIMESSN